MFQLYAVAINALIQREGYVQTKMSATFAKATSEAEARGLGIQLAKETWITDIGWHSHGCSVYPIPHKALEDVLGSTPRPERQGTDGGLGG